MRDSALMAIDG
jgi:hypothetical protein